MEHHIAGGTERDIWVMVDQNGRQTLYRLVEVEDGRDLAPLAGDLRWPVVMIDVVAPPIRQLEATPGACPGPAQGKLIVLRLHTVNDGDAVGVVAHTSRAAERIATFEWRIPSSGEQGKG
jgi:hypothetical protein